MEKSVNKITALLIIASVVILASDAAQLMPVYENGSPNKLFQITKPLVLTCNVSEGGDITKIEWFKDDKKLETVGSRHYAIKKAEGSLIIERTREEDAGEYSCQLGSEKHSFFVSAIVIVKVPENVYVVENEKLEIACIARGTEPKITWMFSNSTDVDGPFQEIQSGGRYKLDDHENIANSRLVIDHAELSDRGFYKCVGISDFMKTAGIASAESDSMVRVKDKLAALWPFLGICAEVFILCAIILIYEKRRNKTDLDESDTDQSPDQKNDHKDSDVRHRK